MKTFITIFIFLNVVSYGEIRDEENIISIDELPKIENEIKKIQNSQKVRVVINTLQYGEGFVVEDPQNTIIINLGKSENGNLRIENNFSRDLNMEDNEEELNALSDNLSPLVEKGEIEKYLLEYLSELNKILSRKAVDKSTTFFNILYESRWSIIKFLALVLTIVNILVRIKHVSKLKQERYEMKLAKEHARREEMKILNEKRKRSEK